ncbi:MAG: hypothetical protein U1B78_08340 [Dehalococcoidia bacterium]|nr:hypothetical protein [Dehalococcoidia bacterium]
MPTATKEQIVISADDCGYNAAGFQHRSWTELTTWAPLPEAFSGYLFTQIIYAGTRPAVIPLRGEDYPALVRLWDNDVDAIYDTF